MIGTGTQLAPGENQIGQVNTFRKLAAALALSLDTNIHADGDVLANTQIVAAIARANDVSFEISSLVVIDKDHQHMGMDIYFLDDAVDLGTENSPMDITDAESANIMGVVQIAATEWLDCVAFSLCPKTFAPMLMTPKAGTDDIYIGAVSRGTGTYSAAGVTVRIGVE